MDTIQTTVAENALGKDIKHLASTATTAVAADSSTSSSTTTNMNSIAEKPDEYKTTVGFPAAVAIDAGNGDDKKGIRTEETDDLLEKIDEAVKDKNPSSETLDNDISHSSEHDFIKKLEEIENDGKENVVDVVQNLSREDNETKSECNSEKVVVGKLVLEVSSDNTTKEEAAGSSTRDEGNDIEKSNDNKVNTNATTSPTDSAVIESITDGLSGAVGEMNSAKKDELVQQEVDVIQKEKTIEKIENKTEIINDSVPEKVESSLTIETKSTEPTALKQVQPPPPVPSISSENIASSEIQENTTESFTEITKDISKIAEVEKNPNNVKDVKKNVESMSVDLTDPLSEPMDVDAEEKMDVDNDVIDEINDEEMKPASAVTINIEQKLKTAISEAEIMKATSKSEEVIKENTTKVLENVPNQSEILTDSENKLAELKEKLTPTKKIEMERNNIVEQEPQLQSKCISPQKSTLSQKITLNAASSMNASEVDAKFSASTTESTNTSNADGVEKENNSHSSEQVEQNQPTTHSSKSPICKDTVQSDKNVDHSIISAEKEQDDEKQKYSKEVNESEYEQQNKIDSPKTKKVSSPSPTKVENHPLLTAKDSGSTASLTSTTDEQIIKFGAETTIDLEIDQQPLKKLENKPLLNAMKLCGSNSSLNTTPVTTAANVFNSTPIQKQFEISSENVSKISGATEISRSDKTVEEDGSNLNKSPSKHEYSSESGTCTSTGHQSSTTEHHSSDHQKSDNQSSSSDGMKKYMNFITKCNGLTDSGTDVENTVKIRSGTYSSGVGLLSTTASSDFKKDSLYEINVWYHQNEIAFLSIENLDLKKMSSVSLVHDASEQGSSTNGSVTSLPPFTLSTAAPLPELSSSSSTVSEKTDGKANTPSSAHSKKAKFTIQGLSGLCRFVIEEFTKIEKSLNPAGAEDLQTSKSTAGKHEEEDDDLEDDPKTPKSQSSKELIKKNVIKGGKTASDSSPSPVSRDRRARKRSYNKTQSDDEDENKSKAKQPRKTPTSKTQGTPSSKEAVVVVETSQCDLAGQCVLAKWVDKKYYAGKITGDKPGNKFVVLFEDGASKILPRESIVFGEGDLLPLQDRYVHALVDDDFENGIVLSIDKVDEKVLYTVKAETKTVKVSASDIYLSDDQAKAIQNAQHEEKSASIDGTAAVGVTSRPTRHKRASASPIVPEAGYSGGVTAKKGAKRQKRYS